MTRRQEINAWLLENSPGFSKAEIWPLDIKRSILFEMNRSGYCCNMSDIRIEWNWLVAEYVIYIKNDFSGYVEL